MPAFRAVRVMRTGERYSALVSDARGRRGTVSEAVKRRWKDNWGRLLGLAAMGGAALSLIRGGVPPELAIGIPVALLLVNLPGMYYVFRERRSRAIREVPCGKQ